MEEEFYEIKCTTKKGWRYEKQRRKKIAKFQKSLKLPKDYTSAQLDEAVINYAKAIAGTDKHFYGAKLTDRQHNSSEFMLKLYDANPEITVFYQPTSKLQQDLAHMVEYFIRYNDGWLETGADCYNVISKNCSTTENRFAYLVAYRYDHLAKNFEFYDMFEKAFSSRCYDINIIRAMYLTFDNINRYMSDNLFADYLKTLPKDFIINQARKFGVEVLDVLPSDVAADREIIKAAVECDGFESLNCLDVDVVLKNKDLVVEAYKKQGIKELAEFISESLSPYVKEGNHTVYYKSYADAQKQLIEDPEIAAILQVHKNEINVQFEQKGSYIIKPAESAAMAIKSGSSQQKNHHNIARHSDAKFKSADGDIDAAMQL